MFDPLVDGQDGYVAGAREAAGVKEPLQAAEHARRTIGRGDDPVDEVRTRQVEGISRDRPALVRQQRCVAVEKRLDPAEPFASCNSTYCGHVAPPTGNATTGYSKSSTTALAAAFSTSSSIGSARSAASTLARRPRVSGFLGVNSVQQSWSGMMDIG